MLRVVLAAIRIPNQSVVADFGCVTDLARLYASRLVSRAADDRRIALVGYRRHCAYSACEPAF